MSDKDENMEGSFNDAELQDIMNEIESLEKEFVEEEGTQAQSVDEPTAEQTEEPTAQEEVEEPQAEHQEEDASEDFADEAASFEADTTEEPTNVVPMSAAKTKAPTAGSGEGYMQFSGQGEMDMQLNFQLGEETATVNIKGGCLSITLAGVELELSENGCEVQMEGGVKFSVPLTGGQAKGKKAV